MGKKGRAEKERTNAVCHLVAGSPPRKLNQNEDLQLLWTRAAQKEGGKYEQPLHVAFISILQDSKWNNLFPIFISSFKKM